MGYPLWVLPICQGAPSGPAWIPVRGALLWCRAHSAHENREVVCRGVNNHANNPTFHGEMQAINDCARTWPQLKGDGAKAEWAKLVLYTTAEPCPMCMAAIEWCGMPHMYYGTGMWELEKMGLHQIDVESRYISSKKNFGTPCQITGGILSDITNKMFEASKNHTAHHRHNCTEHGHARPEGLLEELPRD